jgi:hypothetical protein
MEKGIFPTIEFARLSIVFQLIRPEGYYRKWQPDNRFRRLKLHQNWKFSNFEDYD